MPIEKNLSNITSAIEKACKARGRKTDDVQFIAVTKNRDIHDIQILLDQGQRHFGENRLQEAMNKWPALKEKYPDVVLHFIGHLQSNKASEAVSLFDTLHSIDRPSIAKAVAQEMRKQQKEITCFVQVNTGDEPQKGGISVQDLPSFLKTCEAEYKIPLTGFMCIPPVDDIPDLHFALLDKLCRQYNMPMRSMGMSGDFETAIAFGATHIRIGSALFTKDLDSDA